MYTKKLKYWKENRYLEAHLRKRHFQIMVLHVSYKCNCHWGVSIHIHSKLYTPDLIPCRLTQSAVHSMFSTVSLHIFRGPAFLVSCIGISCETGNWSPTNTWQWLWFLELWKLHKVIHKYRLNIKFAWQVLHFHNLSCVGMVIWQLTII